MFSARTGGGKWISLSAFISDQQHINFWRCVLSAGDLGVWLKRPNQINGINPCTQSKIPRWNFISPDGLLATFQMKCTTWDNNYKASSSHFWVSRFFTLSSHSKVAFISDRSGSATQLIKKIWEKITTNKQIMRFVLGLFLGPAQQLLLWRLGAPPISELQ